MRLATFTAQNMSISKFGGRRGFRCPASRGLSRRGRLYADNYTAHGRLRLPRDPRVSKGAYHSAKKKSGNFGLKSNGTVIFRKIRSEIEYYLQRWSGTAEISLHLLNRFPVFSLSMSLSREKLREIELHMVSAISFGWFVDFGKNPYQYLRKECKEHSIVCITA